MTEVATTPTLTPPPIAFSQFLESVPPGRSETVGRLRMRLPGRQVLVCPDVRLECSSPRCGGLRTFHCTESHGAGEGSSDYFLNYKCRNCTTTEKIFAIRCVFDGLQGTVIKYGEVPAFGPSTPARAMTLIGADRELFLKGRRCENQGLGVGAFTYYRRVIEDQKGRIFDEMIRVLETIDPTSEVIAELKSAKLEQRFSASIDTIKHAMPASLLINGQNPLKLLHSALSEGLHALTDEQCLALATAIRTILFEFSERLAQALRDDAELAKAIALLNKPAPRI